MRKILTGDEVVIISGRNKGSRGTVRKFIPEVDRVVVEDEERQRGVGSKPRVASEPPATSACVGG